MTWSITFAGPFLRGAIDVMTANYAALVAPLGFSATVTTSITQPGLQLTSYEVKGNSVVGTFALYVSPGC